jgi:hypothetical protein
VTYWDEESMFRCKKCQFLGMIVIGFSKHFSGFKVVFLRRTLS